MNALGALLDRLWSFLAGGSTPFPHPDATLEDSGERAARALYATSAALLLPHGAASLSLVRSGTPYPLWPVRLLGDLPPSLWVPILGSLLPLALLTCALWPRQRGLRVVAALATLVWIAARSSGGKIDHSEHNWVVVLSTLAAVGPSGARGGWTFALLAAQALVGLSYSMAGLWKIAAACVQQFVRGEVGYLRVDGMATQVAERVLQSGGERWLAGWVIELPFLGFLLGWVAIYIEGCALFAAVRPELMRVWGVLLIGLHIGIEAAMGINFEPQAVLIALLFVASPIAQPSSVRGVVSALPLVAMTCVAVRALRRPAAETAGTGGTGGEGEL